MATHNSEPPTGHQGDVPMEPTTQAAVETTHEHPTTHQGDVPMESTTQATVETTHEPPTGHQGDVPMESTSHAATETTHEAPTEAPTEATTEAIATEARELPDEPVVVEQPNVEVDSDLARSETDSALGDSDASTFSESLRSSIYNHRYENGRRYHAFKDGAYLNPDDEAEQERLDLLHHLWKMMLNGRLYTAPIASDPQYILDIGTGTGIWAIEVADEHPTAKVIGTDLSPIQPTWVPPNCSFYVDDAETDWLFTEKFDLIHGRGLCGSIGNWPKFFLEAKANLKPGAWLEMQDYEAQIQSDDDTINRAKWTIDWVNEINRGSEMFGKSLYVADKYANWMREAGFEDVREEIIKIPIGTWAKDKKLKEMGAVERAQMIESVEAFTLALYTRVLNYSVPQTQVIMEGVKKEFADKQNHWYIRYHFVTGRRPEQ